MSDQFFKNVDRVQVSRPLASAVPSTFQSLQAELHRAEFGRIVRKPIGSLPRRLKDICLRPSVRQSEAEWPGMGIYGRALKCVQAAAAQASAGMAEELLLTCSIDC